MIESDKKSLRREILRSRKAYIKTEQAQRDSDQIEALAAAYVESCRRTAQKADFCVFCYVSAGWEVPSQKIIDVMLRTGIRVCVPRCKDNGKMDAVVITSFSDLKLGMYDLLEPDETAASVSPETIDLCIVPAMAFDRRGFRLGRGGGYYDRFLTRVRPDCITVGLAFSEFVLDYVPTDPYDRAVDHILTQQGMLF